jgi:hypothetical protein
MKKGLEVTILAVLCLFSVILGWVIATGARDIGTALFFYLLSVCFFLAIFRPSSSL